MLTEPTHVEHPNAEGSRTLATRPITLAKSALPDHERGFVVVRPGDSLVSLAHALLGDGGRWREIWELNREFIPNPRTILPGQTLRLPRSSRTEPEQTSAEVDSAEATTRTYVVRSMDSLSWIAKRELGSGSRWREIWLLNRDRLPSPNLLYPGMALRIPSDPPERPEERAPAPIEAGALESIDPAPSEPESCEGVRIRAVREQWGGVIDRASEQLGLPVDVAAALCAVEHRQPGFERDGELRIRFERQIFAARTGKWIANLHRNPEDERRALAAAIVHDEEAAYACLSMGGSGLKGFRARQVGYGSAREMWEAMGRSEAHQLDALLRLCASDEALVTAAAHRDWIAVDRHVGRLRSTQAGRAVDLQRFARLYGRL